VSVLCNSTLFESVVVGMWWISITVLGAMFIIAALGFCIGYMVAEMKCTKKLEKALEEMTEAQNNV
jgi:Flp pilus assembly protein TadB